MDLRPNRRLNYEDFYDNDDVSNNSSESDNELEDIGDFIDGDEEDTEVKDDDPLNDTLPSIPDPNINDLEEDIEIVEDDEEIELTDDQLSQRAACPNCEVCVVEVKQLFLFESCGHFLCGECEVLHPGRCAICGFGGEKLLIKM